MTKPGSSRFSDVGWWFALAIIVLAAVCISSRCGGTLEPDLSYDGISYLNIAETLVRTHRLPPLEFRPPLYPLLIAPFVGAAGVADLAPVVLMQRAAWIACAVIIFCIVRALRVGVMIATASALVFCSLAGPLRYVHIIYAETFAMLAMLVAMLAFVRGCCASGRRALLWFAVAAVVSVCAAYLRPIFQVLPISLGIVALLDRRRSILQRIIAASTFVVVLIVAVGPWYLWHARTRGSAFFVKTASFSLANYLGDRRLLGKFPAKYRDIGDFYQRLFEEKPDSPFISWWEAQGDWVIASKSFTGGDFDRLHAYVGKTSSRVLLANPGYYITRWWETWKEFSTAVDVVPTGCPTAAMSRIWGRLFAQTGIWLPWAILGLELARWTCWGRRASGAYLAPIAIYLAIGLANTAIEPWPGQARYRSPVEPALLIAAVVASVGAYNAVRAWFAGVRIGSHSHRSA